MDELRVLELFSGIGGMHYALNGNSVIFLTSIIEVNVLYLMFFNIFSQQTGRESSDFY